MNLLLIDNFDSFTFNLVHYLEALSVHTVVMRSDLTDIDIVQSYDAVVISPGPGLPAQAGRSMELIQRFAKEKPILGVCLGLQAIVEVFGGKLRNLDRVLHGVALNTSIVDAGDPLFYQLPPSITTGHYHSWVADHEHLPDCFSVSAYDEYNNIMAIRHKELPLTAVQFHPESVLTPDGYKILSNWVNSVSYLCSEQQ